MEYNLDKEATIEACLSILSEYAGAVTLRQLYYQLVARGLETNDDKVYKRLTSILADARREGQIPYDALEDRGRSFREGSFHNDPAFWGSQHVIDRVRRWIQDIPAEAAALSRWAGQPHYVSVWVEKEALASVIEAVCSKQGVAWTACKGYPSLSLLYDYAKAVVAFYSMWDVEYLADKINYEEPLRPVILYLGDHDPDGLTIPRSIEGSLTEMWASLSDSPDFEILKTVGRPIFKRIALTREQILKHSPPPFPAKPSSSRFAGYVAETGLSEAWELDALPPDMLTRLIEGHVRDYFDGSIYEDAAEVRAEVERLLKENVALIMRGEATPDLLPMLKKHGILYQGT